MCQYVFGNIKMRLYLKWKFRLCAKVKSLLFKFIASFLLFFKAYDRLSQWGISVERKAFIRKLDEIGKRPYQIAEAWKRDLGSPSLDNVVEVRLDTIRQNVSSISISHPVFAITEKDGKSAKDKDIPQTEDKNSLVDPNTQSATEEVILIQPSRDSKESKRLYQIIFDNLDFFVNVRHMTSEKRHKSTHWVNTLLVHDRILSNGLCESKPMKSVYELYNADFVPNLAHHKQLLEAVIPLFTRALVDNLPAFSSFQNVVVRHLPHKYSKITQQASEQVSTDIIEKCTCNIYSVFY